MLRSRADGPDGGWSSIAIHMAPAEGGKEGFYLTLIPDNRPPAKVFLSPRQAQQLLDLAQDGAQPDHAIWDYVAKIPLEPLLPSRTLATRLRWLLADFSTAIREQVRLQLERRPPPQTPTEEIEPEPGPSIDDPSAPAKPPWQIS